MTVLPIRDMAPFLADKQISQQGFLSSEPYVIEKAGVKPVVHLIADAGFENYNTTINLSRKMVEEKKDLVQRFVTATMEGWAEYLKGGPAIEAANAQILKDNPDMDAEKLAFAKPDAIVMHPGPMNRGVEIDGLIADDINVSVIQEQVEMGVAVRMAAMDLLARNLRARNDRDETAC